MIVYTILIKIPMENNGIYYLGKLSCFNLAKVEILSIKQYRSLKETGPECTQSPGRSTLKYWMNPEHTK